VYREFHDPVAFLMNGSGDAAAIEVESAFEALEEMCQLPSQPRTSIGPVRMSV
jgi:hypothetical protein